MSTEVTSVSITTNYHDERSPSDSEEEDDRGRDSVEMGVPQSYVSDSMKNNSLPMIFKLGCKLPLAAAGGEDRTLIATPPLALVSSPNGLGSDDSLNSDDSDTVSHDHSANDTISRDTLDEEQERLSEDDKEVIKRNRPLDNLDLMGGDKRSHFPDDLLIPSPMFMRKLSDRRSKVLESMGTLPSILVPPEEMAEDDVFQCEEKVDKNRTEKKLVDWALNVYVPACRTLLQRCAAKKVDAKKVLSDLRNLANTVNFFCTEHQKQNEIRSTHGMSPSHSSVAAIDAPRSHNTSPILPRSRLLPSPLPLSLSPTPQESEASVAVKVLRSVSSSLLYPLLEEADRGFSKELYKDIVVAIQKISWKVEACLTYNNQGEEYNVHKRIFDVKQTGLVGSMMTALPPEEPSFHTTSPVHFVRGAKRSSKRWLLRTNTDPEKEEEAVLASSANTRDSALDDTPHDPFTSGDRNFERRSGDSSSLSDDFHTRDEPGSPPTSGVESDMDYFRHTRRTTISLSKREVKSLGLHMLKPVDTSSHHRSNTMGAVNMISQLHMMNQVTDDEPLNLRRVRDKVKAKIAKDFPEMDTERCGTPTDGQPRLSAMREDGEEYASKVTSSVGSPLDLLSPTTTSPPLQIHQQPSQGRISLISDMSLDPDYILVERPPSSTPGNRGRIKSLEPDHLLDTTNPPQPRGAQRAVTPSSSFDARDHYAASTMPHNKRKSVFSKMMKKKGPSKSFGRGDTIGRKRRNLRTRSTTLFSEEEDQKEPLFLESIEKFSRNVLPKDVPLEREESTQLVLTVELVSSKVSRPHQKRKSSITADFLSSSLLLEITVCSDIPELTRQGEYKILRTQKDLITLYDTLEEYSSTHLSPGAKSSVKFPDRPDKKKLVQKKERRQHAEELLRFFARRPELRTCDAFLEFLRPDDVFSTLQHKDSESFELLMTFYTPLEYRTGAPGSRHEVAVIGRDIATHTPTTPLHRSTSTSSKKYSALSEGSSSVQVARVPGTEEDDVTLMIKEEGVPVLVVIEDESRHMVMAGRFEKLVEQLACQKKPDPRYVSTFLLGYRHFSTSEDLLSLLIRRFQKTVPPDASEEEMAYAEKWRYVIQLRVLDVLAFWMRTCWEDFHRNANMLEKLRQFISELKAAEDPNFQVAGHSMDNLVEEKLQILTKRGLPSPAHSLRNLQSPSHSLKSTTSPAHSHKDTQSPGHTAATSITTSSSSLPRSLTSTTTNGHRRQLSVDSSSLTAIQLARQLTLIELNFLKAIDVYELAVYLWESNNPNNKPYRRNLDAYITRFNKVSYWVASEICSIDDVKLRGTLIEKFIEVAKHCLEYKNFNTLVSVVTGISLSAVRRLKKSWEHVNEKSVKAFQKLKELTNPVRSHAMYRKTLAAVSPRCSGCIPYFGVFMRDVTLFNEGNPKRLRNGLLNFSKLRTLVVMFEELKHFQRSKYYFPSDDRTRQYCIELVCMSEQDLYDTSLALEPREAEQPST